MIRTARLATLVVTASTWVASGRAARAQAVGAPDDSLTDALADDDPEVRRAAIVRLVSEGGRRSLPMLALLVAGDDATAVRKDAAVALGLLGDPRAEPVLWGCMSSDRDPDVRLSCRKALNPPDEPRADEPDPLETDEAEPESSASAEQPKPAPKELRRNVVFVNPATIVSRALSIGWERAMLPGMWLAVAPYVQYGTQSSGTPEIRLSVKTKAVGLILQPHFYLRRMGLRGPYAAPFGAAVWGSIDQATSFGGGGEEKSSASFRAFGAGVVGGWSWILSPANLKVGLGFQWYRATVEVDGVPGAAPAPTVALAGLGLAGDVKIGFVF